MLTLHFTICNYVQTIEIWVTQFFSHNILSASGVIYPRLLNFEIFLEILSHIISFAPIVYLNCKILLKRKQIGKMMVVNFGLRQCKKMWWYIRLHLLDPYIEKWCWGLLQIMLNQDCKFCKDITYFVISPSRYRQVVKVWIQNYLANFWHFLELVIAQREWLWKSKVHTNKHMLNLNWKYYD